MLGSKNIGYQDSSLTAFDSLSWNTVGYSQHDNPQLLLNFKKLAPEGDCFMKSWYMVTTCLLQSMTVRGNGLTVQYIYLALCSYKFPVTPYICIYTYKIKM